jgi:hypothetical protein
MKLSDAITWGIGIESFPAYRCKVLGVSRYATRVAAVVNNLAALAVLD